VFVHAAASRTVIGQQAGSGKINLMASTRDVGMAAKISARNRQRRIDILRALGHNRISDEIYRRLK
jgi:hypothetical protein